MGGNFGMNMGMGGMMGMNMGMGGMMGMNMGMGGMMGMNMGMGGMMGMQMGMMGNMGMMGMQMGMMGNFGMMGCHPGCFPAGTPVLTMSGSRSIEEIKAGDYVLGVDKDGNPHKTKVHSAFVTENYLVEVETEGGQLITTAKQPVCLSCGCSKPAGELTPGDVMLRWVNGKVQQTKVISINKTRRLVQVFNLVLDDQEFYVAGGFQVRSKPPLVAVAEEPRLTQMSALPPQPVRK
jgi:hypothetical protein